MKWRTITAQGHARGGSEEPQPARQQRADCTDRSFHKHPERERESDAVSAASIQSETSISDASKQRGGKNMFDCGLSIKVKSVYKVDAFERNKRLLELIAIEYRSQRCESPTLRVRVRSPRQRERKKDSTALGCQRVECVGRKPRRYSGTTHRTRQVTAASKRGTPQRRLGGFGSLSAPTRVLADLAAFHSGRNLKWKLQDASYRVCHSVITCLQCWHASSPDSLRQSQRWPEVMQYCLILLKTFIRLE